MNRKIITTIDKLLRRPIRRKSRFWFVVFSLAVLLALNWAQIRNLITPVEPGYNLVTEVHDGDTLSVDMAGLTERIRLIGVDTPETNDPRKPVQCYGYAASLFTKQLVEQKSVRLESDSLVNNRDRYNRLLRYVYLDDGTLLNAEIIKQGYGFAYTSYPFQKLNEFRGRENTARAQSKGLWAACKNTQTELNY